MLPQHVLLALISACAAVPLNINLGAYSPALVVGDGEISLGSAESTSELMSTLASGAANNEAGQQQAKRNLVRTVDHLGKRSPAPEAEDMAAAVESAMQWIKRDLQGFNAALSYAREAIKDGPKVELGTGEGGAGVGIIVNAGENVNKDSAANGALPTGQAAERKVKREEIVEESETPKMTLVAITEV